MNTDTFASFVAKLRKKREMTQKDLAEALGFTPQGISRFESLDSGFDLTLVDRLCRVLDISFTELCSRQIEDTHYVEFALDYDALAKEIKRLREEKKISQEELSAKAKITSRSLRSYEGGGSLPSFQTLERIALALDTDPLHLLAPKKEEIPVGETIPPRGHRFLKTKWLVPIIVASIIASVAIGLPIGLLTGQNAPRQMVDNNAADNSESSVPISDSYIPASEFSEPISDSSDATPSVLSSANPQELPKTLIIDIPKNDFEAIGETIEFSFYDPEMVFSFDELGEDDYTVYATGCYFELTTLEVEIVSLGGGRAQATLKEGYTGDMLWLNISFNEEVRFEQVSYLRYISGEDVICHDDENTRFDDGKIRGDKNLYLNQNTIASARTYLSLDGGIVFINGSMNWISGFIVYSPANPLSYMQNIAYGIGDDLGRYEIDVRTDEPVVSDDIYFFAAVFIRQGENFRPFYLAPWHLHLVK